MAQDTTGIYAAFSIEPVEMGFLSQQAGRPIFEDREFVKIIIAGDKHNEVYREATENDKDRFHEVYARFKRGLSDREQIVGTPLKEWTRLKPSQVRELESLNIYTVEQLSSLSDTIKQNLGMGAHDLVAAAKGFLEAAKDSSAASSYAAENERLKAEIAALSEQVKELGSILRDVTPPKRGPGRPRAEEADAA